MVVTIVTFKRVGSLSAYMPTVKISNRHNDILEDRQERLKDHHGFSPQKKQLVEKAIEEEYVSE